MPNDEPIHDVMTGGRSPFSALTHTLSSAAFADVTDVLDRQVGDLHTDTSELRRAAQLADLEERQASAAKASGQQILVRLSEIGFAWRDIARIVGVSVPAVRKWRRGEGMTGENRLRLAKIIALIELLEQQLINEPVSWLEMPAKDGVSLSAMDLLVSGRFDLVLDLARAGSERRPADPILDAFNPNWRSRYIDTAHEVYIESDGMPAIREKA